MVKVLIISIGLLTLLSNCTPGKPSPVVFDRKLTVSPGTPITTTSCSSDPRHCATAVSLEVIYSFQKTQPGDVSEPLIFTHNFTACEIIAVDISPPSLTFTAAGSQKVTVTAKVPCPCPAGSLEITTRHRNGPAGGTAPFVSDLKSIPIPECL